MDPACRHWCASPPSTPPPLPCAACPGCSRSCPEVGTEAAAAVRRRRWWRRRRQWRRKAAATGLLARIGKGVCGELWWAVEFTLGCSQVRACRGVDGLATDGGPCVVFLMAWQPPFVFSRSDQSIWSPQTRGMDIPLATVGIGVLSLWQVSAPSFCFGGLYYYRHLQTAESLSASCTTRLRVGTVLTPCPCGLSLQGICHDGIQCSHRPLPRARHGGSGG